MTVHYEWLDAAHTRVQAAAGPWDVHAWDVDPFPSSESGVEQGRVAVVLSADDAVVLHGTVDELRDVVYRLSEAVRWAHDTTRAAAVRKGAEFLDEHRPGWADGVDVERLDLSHPTADLLGQLFGAFHKGLRALGETTGHSTMLDLITWAEAHGLIAMVDSDDEWAALTDLWRDEVGRRVA